MEFEKAHSGLGPFGFLEAIRHFRNWNFLNVSFCLMLHESRAIEPMGTFFSKCAMCVTGGTINSYIMSKLPDCISHGSDRARI